MPTTTTSTTVSPACPLCNASMTLKSGRFGPFWSCNNYRTTRCRGLVNVKRSAVKVVAADRDAILRLSFTPTTQQLAIWSAVEAGIGHVVVEALAGTGKTTTMRVALAKLSPADKALYCVFNKRNQEEMVERGVPANATVKTLNAIGFAQYRRAFPKVLVKKEKTWDLFDEVCPMPSRTDAEKAHRKVCAAAVCQLVGWCKGLMLTDPTAADLLELTDRHNLEMTDAVAAVVLPAVAPIVKLGLSRTHVIDFDDQVFMVVALELPCEKYDVVVLDEAQDANVAQHRMLAALLGPRSRCIVIGDRRQSLYGFRGADTDGMDNLTARLEDTGRPVARLGLTVTQRCPVAVVREAQKYVPDIQARDGADEGTVRQDTVAGLIANAANGDFVVCRTNAPLAHVAYGIIKRGQKAVILGRDIGSGLLALVDKLHPTDVGDLLVKLDDFQAGEEKKLANARNADAKLQAVADKCDCLRVFAMDADTVEGVKDAVKAVFTDDPAAGTGVTLSSIHKAKGLEADRVYWLAPEITCKADQEWQAVQEQNCKYVAVTRAKRELVYVPGKGAAKSA